MSVDPNRLKIDQLTRVLESMGWEVVAVDLQTPIIKVIVQSPKQESQTPR